MKYAKIYPIAFLLIMMNSCIQDDFIEDTIDPEIRITSIVDTIGFNDNFQFEYVYLDNTGQIEEVDAVFSSSNSDIIPITLDGLASGLESGEATLYVSYDNDEINVVDSILVSVGANTSTSVQVSNGEIQTTSSYQLEGDFEFRETTDGVVLELGENYIASTALPGLYVYLSNNKTSIANAHEIGAVEVFSGAHQYEIANVNFDDFSYIVYFCKPFNVKVGDGDL